MNQKQERYYICQCCFYATPHKNALTSHFKSRKHMKKKKEYEFIELNEEQKQEIINKNIKRVREVPNSQIYRLYDHLIGKII